MNRAPRPSRLSAAAAALAALLLSAAPLAAQWSGSSALNLSLADAASDQAQPKLAPTSDGGAWLSWFDGIASGWDVRVQRVDLGGQELLPHNGVLVADRNFSSTQDYGLDVAPDGSALLAYRDDSGVGVQIAVARVLPDGTVAWAVQVTSTAAFVAAPVVAGLADGSVAVAWTEGSSTRLRRLDSSGAPLGPPLTFTPGAGSYSVADMHGAGNDVIVSFVHQTGAFGSPRHLLAQKVSPAGTLLWGAGHLSVFDGGSLQFGNFPDFIPDGSGGALFAWYDASSPQLQCYAQHVLSGGGEAFPHNGAAGSTSVAQLRVSPSVSYDASSGSTYLFWQELDLLQSQSGVYGQRFDAAGVRQWGPTGAIVVPVGASSRTQVSTLRAAGRNLVVWDDSPAFGNDTLLAARVDDAGLLVQGPFAVASTPSSKSRLAAAASLSSHAMLVWQDDRSDPSDLLGQNVNVDGTLGARWTDLGGALSGINGSPRLTGLGCLAAGFPLGLALEHGPPSALALLWIALNPTPLPFFGGVVHASPHNAQILLGTNPGGALSGLTVMPPGFPPGSNLWFQFVLQDLSTLHQLTLSNGLRGTTP